MEAFATTSIVLLVGMAIPIIFLLLAVLFDLGVGLYVLFRYWHDRWWPHVRRLVHGGTAHAHDGSSTMHQAVRA